MTMTSEISPCAVCLSCFFGKVDQDINATSIHDNDITFIHHLNVESWKRSIETKCIICTQFWDQCNPTQPANSEKSYRGQHFTSMSMNIYQLMATGPVCVQFSLKSNNVDIPSSLDDHRGNFIFKPLRHDYEAIMHTPPRIRYVESYKSLISRGTQDGLDLTKI